MLGWKLSSEGLFRWLDKTGAIAVESLWWKDGPIRRLPPRFDDVCSEGWLVVLSNNAADDILRVAEQAVHLRAIVRHVKKEREREEMSKVTFNRKEWLPRE
jgi:hypothetical protein